VSERAARLSRESFPVVRPIATRWMDNDVYGHVNNVHYYSYFDTAKSGVAQ
jgi:acyl-CoA thioester hydrolase